MEAISKTAGLKKKRRAFGWIFLISIGVFFASTVQFTMMAPVAPADHALSRLPPKTVPIDPSIIPPSPPHSAPSAPRLEPTVIVSIFSLFTSLASLIGFFSTTILDWKKEKRETLTSELEIQKKELELEKLRMELSKSDGKTNDESA